MKIPHTAALTCIDSENYGSRFGEAAVFGLMKRVVCASRLDIQISATELRCNHCRTRSSKNAPKGKILKSDIGVAKNYLIEREIGELERIVSMYLDYAENQAARQIPMKMANWVSKLDAFLQFNEYEVLTNAGKVSAEVAKRLAEEQFEQFRVQQDRDFESDFEAEVKRIERTSRRKKSEP